MTALPWFRMYHRIIDDDKLRLLAFEDRWHFVALCCLKADGLLDDPVDGLRDRRIAVKLGVQVRELEEIGRRLFEVNLVDENLCPVAWNELQYKSDNSSERVKKYREKQQHNKVKRSRNVTVTTQETDTDTETDKYICLEPVGSNASDDALKPEHVVQKWNETAKRLGKPVVRNLTPERRQLLKGRISQYTIDDFLDVFAKIEASAFLRGDTTNWPRGATFDWTFKKANFQKILEGNYDG
jgi:hypothetical protein